MATTGTPGAAGAAFPPVADANGSAMRKWEVLRAHVQDGVSLARAAREAGVAPRTAQPSSTSWSWTNAGTRPGRG